MTAELATGASTRSEGFPLAPPGLWPELMSAKTAARYVDEPSVKTFLRRVGKVYPKPIRIPGRRGDVWRRKDLDACIAAMRGPTDAFKDLADVL